MNKFIIPGLIVTLIIMTGITAYLFGVNQKLQTETQTAGAQTENTNNEARDTANVESDNIPSPSPSIDPRLDIESAITQQNFSKLQPVLADQISVIKYATECCGILTIQETIDELSYLNSGDLPWDFSEASPIVQNLIAADPDNFSGTIVAVAQNGVAVSFKQNDQGLIDKIFMVIDHQLITL